MVRWSEEKTLHFIELYRSNECLWNVRSPLYKNKLARRSGYENILASMNDSKMNVKIIKTKIKNFRSVYHTELKKIKDSKRSGVDESSVYKPSLLWFDALHSFLEELVEYRDAMSTKIESQTSSAENSSDMMPPQESIMHHFISDVMQADPLGEFSAEPPSTCRAQSTSSDQPETSRKKKRPRDGDSVSDTIQRLENLIHVLNTSRRQDTYSEDEFHCFGISVAAQLRKLPLHVAIDTQNKIQNILSAARLKCVFPNTSAAASSSRNSSSS